MCDPKISLSGENDISFKRVSSKKKRELALPCYNVYIDYFKTNNYKNKVQQSLPIKLCVCNWHIPNKLKVSLNRLPTCFMVQMCQYYKNVLVYVIFTYVQYLF